MPNKAASPCAFPGCGGRAVIRGRCHRHKRGTTTERGYGALHERTREQWAPIVATGKVRCPRCLQLISPLEAWDLGHASDRNRYNGPEHTLCNRGAPTKHMPRPW